MNSHIYKLFTIILSAVIVNMNSNVNASVNDILLSISKNNPDIKAAISQASSDSIDLATTNYIEDPSIDFEYLFGAKSVGDKWGIGVSQAFEWPGVYIKRKQANKSKASAITYSKVMKQLEVIYGAKLLCLNLIKTNRQIAIQQEIYNHYEALYNNYSTAYEKREITILDINKLHIEVINSKQVLDELKIARGKIVEDLTALNNNTPIEKELLENITEYPCEDFLPIETYIMQYRELDPENNYYKKMHEAYKIENSVSKMGWIPKFAIGYKYSNEIGDGFNGITIGASIPLFSNRKKTKAAKAQEIASAYTSQSIENTSVTNIKTKFAKAVSLKEQIETYRTAFNFADNQDLLTKALESRQISLLDYIQELVYFLNMENKILDIEHEYYTTMADLNKFSILLNH